MKSEASKIAGRPELSTGQRFETKNFVCKAGDQSSLLSLENTKRLHI
jgi:hypothetical protein